MSGTTRGRVARCPHAAATRTIRRGRGRSPREAPAGTRRRPTPGARCPPHGPRRRRGRGRRGPACRRPRRHGAAARHAHDADRGRGGRTTARSGRRCRARVGAPRRARGSIDLLAVQGERVDGGEREDAGPLLARRGIARDGQLPRHPVASEHLGPEVDPRAVRQRQAQRPRLIGRGESPQAVAHDGARDAGALLLGALIPLLGEPRRLPLALEIVEEVLPPHRSPDPRRRRERGDGEDSYIRVTLGPFLEIRSQFSTSCALDVRRASRTVTVDQSSWSPDRGGAPGWE